MDKQRFIDCERKRLNRIVNFRLSHKFMVIGIAIAGLSFVLLLVRRYGMEGDTEWFRAILRKTLVVGLLIMSLSKDKQEDEMTMMLRSQSYAIAFVIGVIYALVMPYVDFGVGNVLKPEGEVFKDLGVFQTLLFMLLIQLMFYHYLKRFR